MRGRGKRSPGTGCRVTGTVAGTNVDSSVNPFGQIGLLVGQEPDKQTSGCGFGCFIWHAAQAALAPPPIQSTQSGVQRVKPILANLSQKQNTNQFL